MRISSAQKYATLGACNSLSAFGCLCLCVRCAFVWQSTRIANTYRITRRQILQHHAIKIAKNKSNTNANGSLQYFLCQRA